ncbi:MAG: hypothetical protein QW041_03490 [Candidatus Pacearchaeota archaeon]
MKFKEALKSIIPNTAKKAVLEGILLAGLLSPLGLKAADKQDNVICKDGVCWIDTSTKTARTQNLEQRIVFTDTYEIGIPDINKVEIYTCNAIGHDIRRLTFNEHDDSHPYFTPDGKK